MNPGQRIDILFARREAFLGFLASRLGGDRAEAEDLLQQGLAKALDAAPQLRDEERLIPWFYQLLRHALVDRLRSRRAAVARDHRWADEHLSAPEAKRQLCACLEPLIDGLPVPQAELLRRCELGDEPVGAVAPTLGLTPNAASVALHRARAALRKKLQAWCGDCSEGACLDCDCGK